MSDTSSSSSSSSKDSKDQEFQSSTVTREQRFLNFRDWISFWASVVVAALYLVWADSVTEFEGWTRTLTTEILRLSSSNYQEKQPEELYDKSAKEEGNDDQLSVPIPAPRASPSVYKSEEKEDVPLTEKVTKMHPEDELMYPAPNHHPFDSLEGGGDNEETLVNPTTLIGKPEPKIYINTRGEWVFDEDEDVPEDWKEEVPIINRGNVDHKKHVEHLIWSTIEEEEETQPEIITSSPTPPPPPPPPPSSQQHQHQKQQQLELLSTKTIISDHHEGRETSPDNSTDSGVSEEYHLQEDIDFISVKNIAKFWENRHEKLKEKDSKQEEMMESKKKWKSMPDLEQQLKSHLHVAVLADAINESDEEDDDYDESNKTQNDQVRRDVCRPVIKCNVDEDDRYVCNEVPFRERLRLFESMAKVSRMDDKKLWSSMPALDKKSTSHNASNVISYPVYHRSPSLSNKYPSKSAVPLALVGSSSNLAATIGSPSNCNDYELMPLKDRLKIYQQEAARSPSPKAKISSVVKPVIDTIIKKKPVILFKDEEEEDQYNSSLSPSSINFDDSASLTDSIASSHTSNSTVISASKMNKVIPTYSWNDESNGEIYNEDRNRLMYVVENGKEFPLQPLNKRKSLFLNDDKSGSSLNINKQMSGGSKIHHHSDHESSEGTDEELDDSGVVVKSSHVPYIEEEQNVLANINLVKAMKEKFKYN